MKVLLTRGGLGCTFHTTPDTVYTGHMVGGVFWFTNDRGNKQELSDKADYLEIPRGHFVVKAELAPHQDTYSWKEGDYLVCKPCNVSEADMFEVTSSSWTCIMQEDCEVIADPWGVLGTSKGPVGDRGVPTPLAPLTLTEENRKIIKKQKALAAELLERLGFYGNVIVAGGAPRNWWFNQPANDLDFFIQVPQSTTSQRHLLKILEREGITGAYNMATHNPDGTLKNSRAKQTSYDERMSDIHSVFEGMYCGQQVQVIFTRVSTYGYIESHFDTSINMIFSVLTANDTVTVEPCYEFTQGAEVGAIFVHDNQCAYSNKHLEKIAKYFPEVPMVWYEEISECVKNPSYVLEVAKSWEDHLQDQLDSEESDFDDIPW